MTRERKPTIAIITWFFPKISETFVLNQITYLIAHGYRVKIYAVKDATKVPAKEDYDAETVIHSAITRLRLRREVKYISLTMLPSVLRRAMNHGDIDIAYFQFPDLAIRILKKIKPSIPIITSVHDLPMLNADNKMALSMKFSSLFENATFILPISEFTKRELIHLGCPRKKIIVHPMGADPSIFYKPDTYSRKKRVIHLAIVGRFVPKKGINHAVAALHIIHRKHPHKDIRLTIIGDGLLRPQLESLVNNMDLTSVVHFTGKLNQEGVRNILIDTDIFLCPSHVDQNGKREGLPVALIEASLMGIPSVATNHAAIPELASINQGIVLVRENSTLAFAKGIEKILKHINKFSSLARASREQVKNKYGTPFLGIKLEQIIQRSLTVIQIQRILNQFSKDIQKIMHDDLVSLFIVGSIARLEVLQQKSDLDMVIVIKRVTPSLLRSLYKQIAILEQGLGIPVVPQIVDIFDATQLISLPLLWEYHIDGTALWGKPFLDTISRPSRQSLELAVLKRCLFQRYLVRQKIATGDVFVDPYTLAKTVLFLIKYYLWITTRLYPTRRDDILNAWYAANKFDLAPFEMAAIKNILSRDNQSISEKTVWEIAGFIETICQKMIRILSKRYGKIKINSF